tara:strand:+ start:436974 stop:437333 length:360 start_codon:yes stop_codon:yes gene_type:complete
MNTKQVANRLVTLMRQGEGMTAVNELYADTIVSKEMPGFPQEVTSGKEAVTQKSAEWLNNVQEFHKGEISDPQVAGNHFSCTMDFDVTFKDRGRQQMNEICVYEVQNGKIVHEQFFYNM